MDYQEQIKAKEKIIKTYQDAGCKDGIQAAPLARE